MIKKTIKFIDPVDENEVTKDYFFHLNKADLIRILGRDREGDWEKYVNDIMSRGDSDEIMDFIERIIRDAYGYKNSHGEFAKSREAADAFIASEAYGELFVEFVTNPESAKDFFAKVANSKQTYNNVQKIAGANRATRRKNKR